MLNRSLETSNTKHIIGTHFLSALVTLGTVYIAAMRENWSSRFPTRSDKPICAVTEEGEKLEILHLKRRGIALSV